MGGESGHISEYKDLKTHLSKFCLGIVKSMFKLQLISLYPCPKHPNIEYCDPYNLDFFQIKGLDIFYQNPVPGQKYFFLHFCPPPHRSKNQFSLGNWVKHLAHIWICDYDF